MLTQAWFKAFTCSLAQGRHLLCNMESALHLLAGPSILNFVLEERVHSYVVYMCRHHK